MNTKRVLGLGIRRSALAVSAAAIFSSFSCAPPDETNPINPEQPIDMRVSVFDSSTRTRRSPPNPMRQPIECLIDNLNHKWTYPKEWKPDMGTLKDFIANRPLTAASFALGFTPQTGKIDPTEFTGFPNWKTEMASYARVWNLAVGGVPQSSVALRPRIVPVDLTDAELTKAEISCDMSKLNCTMNVSELFSNLGILNAQRLSSAKITIVMNDNGTVYGQAAIKVQKVLYKGAHGEDIPAFVLIPPMDEGAKRPAVLAMHQALIMCGKKEPIGACTSNYSAPWLNFATDLALRGFVTIAPDSVGYGERATDDSGWISEYTNAVPLMNKLIASYPCVSVMGVRISDVMRGFDYLETLPFVDKNKFGMIGHSNGGIETLFNAAFDRRIKAAISNGGPNLFRRETYVYEYPPGTVLLEPGIGRWGAYAYMPMVASVTRAGLPVEFHQLYGMIAGPGRGFFLSLIEDDSIAPSYDRIDWSATEAKRAYDVLGGNFDYVKIASGLTKENRDEWAGPVCMDIKYTDCVKSGGTTCKVNASMVGMTDSCVITKGSIMCAHDIWGECMVRTSKNETVCIAQFAPMGVDATCVEMAYKSLRRDHGWYPEIEAKAYPWLKLQLD